MYNIGLIEAHLKHINFVGCALLNPSRTACTLLRFQEQQPKS